MVATTAYQRLVRNAPSSERNSPTNPEKPGSPIDANVAATNSPPNTGTAFHSPRNSDSSYVWRRS